MQLDAVADDVLVDLWLDQEDAERLLRAVERWLPDNVELRQKMRNLVRHIRLDQAMSSWVSVPRTRGPRARRRRVSSGPRKARAPDDSEPSGDGGEPEPSSGCSPSPQPVDFLDAVALSLGWGRV